MPCQHKILCTTSLNLSTTINMIHFSYLTFLGISCRWLSVNESMLKYCMTQLWLLVTCPWFRHSLMSKLIKHIHDLALVPKSASVPAKRHDHVCHWTQCMCQIIDSNAYQCRERCHTDVDSNIKNLISTIFISIKCEMLFYKSYCSVNIFSFYARRV